MTISRPTRRQFSTLLGSGLIGSALASGRRARAEPRPGGELTVAFDGAAIVNFVLDPHSSGFAPHNRVFRSIYDNLVVLLPNHSVGPWLAQSWEISPDRTQYTFTLRPDVTFHDGTRFNAAAVKFNLDRIKDPRNGSYSLPDIGPYVGAEILSDHVVRIHLSQPFTPLLHNLSSTKLAIVSPAAVTQYGAARGGPLGQHPVGTGPFRFDGLTQGTEIRLSRNPDYRWPPAGAANSGPAHIDRLVFKNVPEQLTRVAALQSGQVDVADLIPPQNLPGLKADPGFQVIEKELLNTNYSLALNVGRAPWNDEDIRRAVKLSLDIDAIVRIVYLGQLPRAWSSLSPSIFGSAEKQLAHSWSPDVQKARQILDAKGWQPGDDGIRVKDGKRLVIRLVDTQGNREQRLDVIQLARRQLAASGIGLVIDSEPAGNYIQKVLDNDYDLVAGAQFAADPDVLRYGFVPDGRFRLSGIRVNDPQLTAWLVAGSQEADPARRAALYQQAQQRIIDKVYSIPIYVLLYNIAVSTAVSGVGIDSHGFPIFQSASLTRA